MSPLKKTIDEAGGVSVVANACGKTPRAVYKWLAADCLPRTEYTGETRYAEKIAALASANGGHCDPAWLLAEAHPNKQVSHPILNATLRASGADRQTAKTSVQPSSTAQASP